MGLGGPADFFFSARTERDVLEVIAFARDHGLPLFPLGGGSNIVVADAGVRGVVLHLGTRGLHTREDERFVWVTAQAGEPWDDLTDWATHRNLQGVECLGGIPGSVGATPIQNVGAYGQEVADTIERVRVVNRRSLEIHELDRESCAFAYRDSFFKREGLERYVVLSVTYRLTKGAPPRVAYPELQRALSESSTPLELSSVRKAVIELRRKKSMVYDVRDENHRSCGSFFVNAQMTREQLATITERAGVEPPAYLQENATYKVPSAWLIDRAGLKPGLRRGSVGLSTRHTLAVVAHDQAKARDIVEFARFVRETVLQKFSVLLEPEPNFWGYTELDAKLPRL